MTTVFADNLTLVADTTATVVTTDPYPAAQYNHLQAVINTHRSFSKGSGLTMSVLTQFSNDGQTWVDASSAETIPASGTQPFAEQVLYSLVRFQFSVIDGSDWGMVVFDLHVTFKHV